MVRKGYTAEQIINKLREVELLVSQGSTIGAASKKIGVTEQTYYRWRKEYGGHGSFSTTTRYRKVAGEEHRKWYDSLWRK